MFVPMAFKPLTRTQSNAHQNIEQFQNPTMGVTTKNEITKTEPPP